MATAATGQAPPPRHRWPLARRLAAILLLLTAGLATLLVGWLEPRMARTFAKLGADFLIDGSAAMRELVHEQSRHTNDLVVNMLAHTTADRDRALRELHLEAFGGGETIRAAITADDARRSAHDRQRAVVLTYGAEQRSSASIDARLRALAGAQAARTDEFVAELRRDHLLLVGLALTTLLLVLGYGQQRLVVRPTRRLREATQRVAAGELDVALPPAAGDELGDLTRDFARMVQQLQTARIEQQRLTDGLAGQVADKTRHLEQALADLRASHQQLAAAERLAALGTLAGGIAHEFHNVIGGIRGCTQELLQDERDPERQQTLAVITRAADRATGIVQQLSRFARRSIERAGELDPVAVVEDALRLCEPAARRQQVAVQRDYADGLRLHGDADGLHQVCVNLLVNALQAMPNGGSLQVRVARRGDEIELAIRDSGTGIDPAHLPHIFEPFFTTRGDAAAPDQRGSGLGLSVSWGIVQAHHGRIEAESVRGSGSTFTVRLPVRPPAAH